MVVAPDNTWKTTFPPPLHSCVYSIDTKDVQNVEEC